MMVGSYPSLLLKTFSLFSLIALVRSEFLFTPIYKTNSGPVRGRSVHLSSKKTVHEFLGIPYAKAERFAYPQKYKWEETLEATQFTKPCPQLVIPSKGAKTLYETTENCLNLNIFVPVKEGKTWKDSLAVVVWIAGLFYSYGNAVEMDGRFLASNEEVIVVTLNNRLGVLGYLKYGDVFRGNYGVADQIMALKWIRANIERFGGDPRHVTLLGQSAGAMSAGLLLTSPQALGLFDRAILLSGSPLSLAAIAGADEAEMQARQIIKAVRCESSPDLKRCLVAKPLHDILQAQGNISNIPIKSPFAPVIDGDLIPGDPDSQMLSGKMSVSEIMLGVVDNEGTILLPGTLPGVTEPQTLSINSFDIRAFRSLVKRSKLIKRPSEAATRIITHQYINWSHSNNNTEIVKSLVKIFTDAAFTAPAIKTARILAKRDVTTFFFRVELKPSVLSGFGSRDDDMRGKTADILSGDAGSPELRNTLVRMIAAFAKTGIPSASNDSRTPLWPRFSASRSPYMSITPSCEVRHWLLPSRMSLWNKLLPSLEVVSGCTLAKREDVKPTTTAKLERCEKDSTSKVLTAVVAIMAIVIIIMLSIIIYQGRTLSKRADVNGACETLQ